MLAAGLCAMLAWSTTSPAQARTTDDPRPWGRGTLMPTFGFGLGFSPDVIQLGFGLGASYFVVGGLSLGLSLDDTIFIYSSAVKNQFPGIEKQIPTNLFRITPSVQYVFYRSYRFSPYATVGVGPSFFNNDNGVFGHWTAGPGAYIGLAGPVFLDVGVGFSGMFPPSRCNDAFLYAPPGGGTPARAFEGFCDFNWGPRIGLVLAFGGRRSADRPSERRRPPPEPPPSPMRAEPIPVEPAPAPAESVSSPSEASPEVPRETAPDEPPSPAEAPVPDVSPSPADAPAPAAPAAPRDGGETGAGVSGDAPTEPPPEDVPAGRVVPSGPVEGSTYP